MKIETNLCDTCKKTVSYTSCDLCRNDLCAGCLDSITVNMTKQGYSAKDIFKINLCPNCSGSPSMKAILMNTANQLGEPFKKLAIEVLKKATIIQGIK